MVQREEALRELNRAVVEGGFHVFPLVVSSEDVETGVHHLAQTAGIGPLKVNTVLANWKGTSLHEGQGFQEILFGRHLREAFRQGCHTVVLATDDAKWPGLEQLAEGSPRIDVWWRDDATGRLMLLLAYLVTRHDDWSRAQIRLLAPDKAFPGTQAEDRQQLADVLETYRIKGEPAILSQGDLDELLQQTADTTLLFLPFRFRDNLIQLEWEGPAEDLLNQLPTTLMVAAARDLDLEAEPEEGRAAELASMRDALDKLHQRLDQAREDALQTAEAAARSQDRLADMLNAETGFIDLRAKKSLEHDIARAQREAEKSRRRALKLEAKLEQTQKEAGQAGLVAPADEAQK
jgi:hypothetical protein